MIVGDWLALVGLRAEAAWEAWETQACWIRLEQVPNPPPLGCLLFALLTLFVLPTFAFFTTLEPFWKSLKMSKG